MSYAGIQEMRKRTRGLDKTVDKRTKNSAKIQGKSDQGLQLKQRNTQRVTFITIPVRRIRSRHVQIENMVQTGLEEDGIKHVDDRVILVSMGSKKKPKQQLRK